MSSPRCLSSALAAACCLSLTGLAGSASADAPAGPDDLAFTLKGATGEYYPSMILSKLFTFKLGQKCWEKSVDKDSGAVHAAGFITRDIRDYAKALTKDDWSVIEAQNNSDREKNKALVEPMIDAFKDRFQMSVTVDGDDCDASPSALWIRYWGDLVSVVKSYPPPQQKIVINLTVTSKVRDVTVTRSKDGTTFSIVAPKDIEAKGANDTMTRPFRLLASGIGDDFAFSTKEATGHYYSAWVLTKFHTFKVGKLCAPKLVPYEGAAVLEATFVTGDIAEYAKKVGGDDWGQIESQSANDPATNRDLVSKSMDEFAKRLHVTVNVDGEDCDASANAMWMRYWYAAIEGLNNYPPKANKVTITINATAKAKDLTVSTSKDGSTITITGPKDKEPKAWSDKIEAAFEKVARAK